MGNHLLVDIGNTNSKFAIYNSIENSLVEVLSINTSVDSNKISDELLKLNLDVGYKAYYSITRHHNAINIISTIGKNLNLEMVNSASEWNLNELGSDIQAGIIGVIKQYEEKDFIIIDLGTAITVTLVLDGKFNGCNIYNGIDNNIKSLKTATGLEFEPIKKIEVIGTTTNSAIHNGVIRNYIRMIELDANTISTVVGIDKVYVTGGDSKLFRKYTNNDYLYNESLVFIGLSTLIK